MLDSDLRDDTIGYILNELSSILAKMCPAPPAYFLRECDTLRQKMWANCKNWMLSYIVINSFAINPFHSFNVEDVCMNMFSFNDRALKLVIL